MYSNVCIRNFLPIKFYLKKYSKTQVNLALHLSLIHIYTTLREFITKTIHFDKIISEYDLIPVSYTHLSNNHNCSIYGCKMSIRINHNKGMEPEQRI